MLFCVSVVKVSFIGIKLLYVACSVLQMDCRFRCGLMQMFLCVMGDYWYQICCAYITDISACLSVVRGQYVSFAKVEAVPIFSSVFDDKVEDTRLFLCYFWYKVGGIMCLCVADKIFFVFITKTHFELVKRKYLTHIDSFIYNISQDTILSSIFA